MGEYASYVNVSECVIISDLLYYIKNKIHSAPVKTIVTTCHAFYTDDDYVFNEKKKLCDATNEVCHGRRNDDKRQKNLDDICAIIVRRDSQGLFLPKCVSVDLSNVPINDDGNPSLGQIMAAIAELKRNMVTTDMLASSLKNLNSSFSSSSEGATAATMNVVNLNQPPPPASVLPSATDDISASSSSTKPPSFLAPKTPLAATAPSFNEIVSASGDHGGGVGGGGSGGGGRGRGGGGRGRGGRGRLAASSQNRQTNSRRDASRSRTVIGKNVNAGLISLKGADLTVNRCVGRVHNDTTLDDLREYITSRTITVIELEQLETRHTRFKSFHLRVKRDDLERMEDAEFWPEGILFSPFFRPKNIEERPQTAGGVTASASLTNGS